MDNIYCLYYTLLGVKETITRNVVSISWHKGAFKHPGMNIYIGRNLIFLFFRILDNFSKLVFEQYTFAVRCRFWWTTRLVHVKHCGLLHRYHTWWHCKVSELMDPWIHPKYSSIAKCWLAGRAAPKDFPRAEAERSPEEQPCQPEENPVLPDSLPDPRRAGLEQAFQFSHVRPSVRTYVSEIKFWSLHFH